MIQFKELFNEISEDCSCGCNTGGQFISIAGTLTTSDSVELLAFDGQKVAKGTAGLSIDSKVHQVVVSVSDIVDGSYFSIDPVILTFNGTDEDAKIVTPNLPQVSL
ncbi:Uncharacterized protein conserved in bacteria (DUF2057) [Actinobacillus equuli]|nr:Uncharacterized protein conserved in bacteria (DUF2057) [Actinobacillus equuli]